MYVCPSHIMRVKQIENPQHCMGGPPGPRFCTGKSKAQQVKPFLRNHRSLGLQEGLACARQTLWAMGA